MYYNTELSTTVSLHVERSCVVLVLPIVDIIVDSFDLEFGLYLLFYRLCRMDLLKLATVFTLTTQHRTIYTMVCTYVRQQINAQRLPQKNSSITLYKNIYLLNYHPRIHVLQLIVFVLINLISLVYILRCFSRAGLEI